MLLTDIVQTGVNSALQITDSFLSDVEYKVITVGAYDSATDTVATTEQTFNFRALKYKLKDEEKVGLYPKSAEAGYEHRKVLFSKTYMPGIEPSLEDTITVDGKPYEIVKVLTVPDNSIWMLIVGRAS